MDICADDPNHFLLVFPDFFGAISRPRFHTFYPTRKMIAPRRILEDEEQMGGKLWDEEWGGWGHG